MKKRALAGLLALMLLLTLTACGGSAKGESNFASTDAAAPEAPAAEPQYGGMAYEEAMSADTAAEEDTLRPAKMIHTASLTLETTAFDDAAAGLAALTERLGGYYEHSGVWSSGRYRWGDYTVRVPVERYMEFLNQAGELCHETGRDTSQQNVSEFYYDTEGRLKTQQIKLERLQTLLTRAENMADIITIESAISETEQRIDELSGTLRHYDDLVDYATITVSLQEVYKLSNVEEVPDSFASRVGAAFSSGWSAFTDGLEDLAVALAYGWMWVLLLAAAVVVVVRVLRRRRSGAAPKGKKQDDKPEET